MKTKIYIYHTNPTNGKALFYIQITTVDSLGFPVHQSSAPIDEEQFFRLKGSNELKYVGETNIYSLTL